MMKRIMTMAPLAALLATWGSQQVSSGELTEEKALELIEPIASQLAPEPIIVRIDLSTSQNFWNPIFLQSLGRCWAQPDGPYPVLTTIAPMYAADAPEYANAGYHLTYPGPFDHRGYPLKNQSPFVYLRPDGPFIKSECKDFLEGVWMWPPGNPSGPQYYPQVLYFVACRSEFDGVRSVLSCAGQAEVKITFTCKPTDFLNELRRVDAAAVNAAAAVERVSSSSSISNVIDPGGKDWRPSGRDPGDVIRSVYLVEYDQGWRVE